MTNIKNNSVSSKQKQLNKKEQKCMKTINLLINKLPKLVNKASRKINEIIKIRIQEAENHNIECILPKIIQDTVKNIYQMPFRLLGKFGTKQLEKSKRHVVKYLRRRQQINVFAHPFSFGYNILIKVVLYQPYFFVNIHPLRYNENPILDFLT